MEAIIKVDLIFDPEKADLCHWCGEKVTDHDSYYTLVWEDKTKSLTFRHIIHHTECLRAFIRFMELGNEAFPAYHMKRGKAKARKEKGE